MSPAETRPPRRMLPSVTDVVNELSRVVREDPAVLFRVARQVVAEELGRVKQGFESASIDVLARRARRLLGPVSGESPGVQPSLFTVPEPPRPAPAPPVVPEPALPAAPAPTPTAEAHADEPFAASSEVDLGWEKDLPIQPDDAPFRSAILPIPRSRRPAGIAPLPDEPAHAVSPAPEFQPPPPPPPSAVPPAPPPAAPEAAEDSKAQEAFEEQEAPPPLPAPSVPSAPPPVRSEAATTFAPAEARPVPPPLPAEELQEIQPPDDADAWRTEQGRITTQEWKALGVPTAETPPPERPEQSAAVPEARLSRVPPPEKAKPGHHGLIAVAAVLVAAAGVAYFFRDTVFKRPVPRPEDPIAARAPRPRTAPQAPAPVASAPALPTKPPEPKAVAPAVSLPPAATPVLARPTAASSGRSKGALIISSDWAGRPPIWVIHFSSHKERAGAQKEAGRLAAALGKTGHAIGVDLGEKGIWYRVLIGDFSTQEAARAYHDELQARNTPDLGFVYQLRGEE